MHPLAGTAWSLFFEYLANIAYALGLRKASNRVLLLLAAISAAVLTHYLVTTPRGDITGGWSVNAIELKIGFIRLLYPFLAGMLLQNAYTSGSMCVMRSCGAACCFCSPLYCRASAPRQRCGRTACMRHSSLFLVFPVIVAMGAGEQVNGRTAIRLCRFSGAISYPLYITHYALIYIYTARVYDGKLTPAQGVAWGAALFFTAIGIAYACLKLYDEPARRWLNRRFLINGTTTT